MKILITCLLLLMLTAALSLKAQEQQVVPYTLSDRDRAIRTEVKMEALEAKMDAKFDNTQKQFDSVKKQFDQLTTLFYWGFGIL
jgi:hypothetical protein